MEQLDLFACFVVEIQPVVVAEVAVKDAVVAVVVKSTQQLPDCLKNYDLQLVVVTPIVHYHQIH